MIVDEEKRVLINSQDFNEMSFGIDREDVPFVMNILRNQIYSDKILAVVREYTTNAVDAHAEAGKADIPIKISVPNISSNEFRVRDYGFGLSQENIENIYTKYCKSTKRQTNLAVGQLGIGCKSGFAYGDSFMIISYFNGEKKMYNACIDDKNSGKVFLMSTQKTDEPTGMEIIIPVKEADKEDFVNRVKKITPFFKVKPEIEGCDDYSFLDALDNPVNSGSNWKSISSISYFSDIHGYERHSYYKSELDFIAVMGGIPYPVDKDIFSNDIMNLNIDFSNFLNDTFLIINFNIGDLSVTSSRESLEYTDKTKESILNAFKLIHKEYFANIAQKFDDCQSREELIDLYQHFKEEYAYSVYKNIIPLTQLKNRNEDYFCRDVSESYLGDIKFNCSFFNFEVYYKDLVDQLTVDSEVFKEDLGKYIYKNHHNTLIYLKGCKFMLIDLSDIELDSNEFKARLLTFFIKNKNSTSVSIIRRNIKKPSRKDFEKIKNHELLEGFSDDVYEYISDYEPMTLKESAKIKRNIISRANEDFFILNSNNDKNTHNSYWDSVEEDDIPSEGVYVPLNRFNLEGYEGNFGEYISLFYNNLKELNKEVTFYGIRKKDEDKLDKTKWKSLYDWLETDLLDILKEDELRSVYESQVDKQSLYDFCGKNIVHEFFKKGFIDKIENDESPIKKMYEDLIDIQSKENNSNHRFIIQKLHDFRNLVMDTIDENASYSTPYEDKRHTLDEVLDGYEPDYYFINSNWDFNERYPLLKYAEFSFDYDPFADYINLIDEKDDPALLL